MSGRLDDIQIVRLAREAVRLADALKTAVRLLDGCEVWSVHLPLSSPLGGPLLGDLTRGILVLREEQIRSEATRILRGLGEAV